MPRTRKKRSRKAKYNVNPNLEGVFKLSPGQDEHGADEYYRSKDGGVVVPQVGPHGGVKNAEGSVVPAEFDVVVVETDDDGEVVSKQKEAHYNGENKTNFRADPSSSTVPELVATDAPDAVGRPVFPVTLEGDAFGSFEMPCLDLLEDDNGILLVLDTSSTQFKFTPKACYDKLRLITEDGMEFEVMYGGQSFDRPSATERFMIFIKTEQTNDREDGTD
jgi:hypothetical protein